VIELGISQAQAQFTRLFEKEVLIVDKKARKKRAVILPYETYRSLVEEANRGKKSSPTKESGVFGTFRGRLKADLDVDDPRYRHIVGE